MARDYTMVSPRIWQSDRFQALPDPVHRLAMMYLLTGPQVTSAGCYRVSLRYLGFDLGIEPVAANDVLQKIADTLLIRYDGVTSVVQIPDWFAVSPPSSGKHALGTLKQLRDVKSPLIMFAINDLVTVCQRRGFKLSKAFHDLSAELCGDADTRSKPHGNGIDRVSEPIRYTDTETDTPVGTEQSNSAVPTGNSEHAVSPAVPRPAGPDSDDIGDIPEFLRRAGVPGETTAPGVGDLASALNRLGAGVKARQTKGDGDDG